MNPQPPRPNPAAFPKMYTPSGRKLHRAKRHNGEWRPLCERVPWWHRRAVASMPANPLEYLIEYDTGHAAKLAECQRCNFRAGVA